MSVPTTVTFYFDPGCPWTWRTSRWLVDVAGRNDVPVTFAAFELSNGAPLDTVPEQYRAGAVASRSFLRAVAVAHDAGQDEVTARAYAAYGQQVHDNGSTPSPQLVLEAWTQAAAGPDLIAALDDDSLDQRKAESRAAAAELAGDDVGSPILAFEVDGMTRAFFGPVLAPTPTGEAADQLWQAVLAAAAVPQFFELKTRRTASPV